MNSTIPPTIAPNYKPDFSLVHGVFICQMSGLAIIAGYNLIKQKDDFALSNWGAINFTNVIA